MPILLDYQIGHPVDASNSWILNYSHEAVWQLGRGKQHSTLSGVKGSIPNDLVNHSAPFLSIHL